MKFSIVANPKQPNIKKILTTVIGFLEDFDLEEETAKIVDEVLSEMGDVDISQMGKVIGAVMAKGDGIDGGAVSKIVKEKLS